MFSIIMAAHNAGATIDNAISSARSQTFRRFELIVVENGSNDNTATAALKQAQADARITVLTDGPQSPGGARNEGIAHARGDWIAFLDADDAYAPRFLETVAASIRHHPELDAHAVNGATIGWHFGSITPGIRFMLGREMDLSTVVSMQLITGQVVLRREALLAIGGFRLEPAAEDFDLWVRFFASHRGRWIPKRLYRYRYDRSSHSHASNRRERMLRSLIESLALARAELASPAALRRILRREKDYKSQLTAWPLRARMIESLAAGEFEGQRAVYLRTRAAYGSRLNWLAGMPVMLLSPRLFARLFTNP